MNGDEQRRRDEQRRQRRAAEVARLRERGYEEHDRGYEEHDRGYEEHDRGYEEHDRGYEEHDRGAAADPRQAATDAFQQATALGGHFIVAFVTPVGRAVNTGTRPGDSMRTALDIIRRVRNGAPSGSAGRKPL
jgi:hypothetical protein